MTETKQARILIQTYGYRLVTAYVPFDVIQNGNPSDNVLVLFHKILEDLGKGPLRRVDQLFTIPAETLEKYGVRFENTDVNLVLDLSRSTILPYSAVRH